MVLPNRLYRKWFLLGLLVQIIAAWFSVGSHHPDEHFQVLEYCNYKMGFSKASDLPWEFSVKCRSAILPFIAWCVSKSMLYIGLYNPAWVALVLRLMMGLLTWLITCRLVLQLLHEFKTDKGKLIFVWCSFLLWFVPYLGVRFSSENFSGLLFFLAISLLLPIQKNSEQKQKINFIIAGLLFGFSLFVRLQMVFALSGLIIWILLIKKWSWKSLILICISGIAAIFICVAIDYWLYGGWVFSPFNYYYVNIVQGVSAQYGVSPWWYYSYRFLESAAPPISLALLLFFIYGTRKNFLHLFSLVCICFVIGHSSIAHKEMRFLFPISFAFVFITCIGIDRWIQDHTYKKLYHWVFTSLIFINIILLIIRIITPTQVEAKYYNFVYDYASNHPTILISKQEEFYRYAGSKVNFYKSTQIKLYNLQQLPNAAEILNKAKDTSVLFFSSNNTEPEFSNYKFERIYCVFPDWVLNLNINWQKRANIWCIYKLKN